MTTLDDIVKAGKDYNLISRIGDGLAKNPTDSNVLKGFLTYNSEKGPEPLDQTASGMMYQDYMAMPMRLGDDVKEAKQEETSALIGAVKGEYETVVNALDEGHLQHTALEMPDRTKSYLALEEAMKAENYAAAKAIYASTSKNEAWQKYLMKYGDTDFVKRHRDLFMNLERKRFMDKHLSVEEEKDGKKGLVYSPEKAKAYVLASPERLKDNEPLAYLEVGKTYTHQIEAEEAEKKSKKKKK